MKVAVRATENSKYENWLCCDQKLNLSIWIYYMNFYSFIHMFNIMNMSIKLIVYRSQNSKYKLEGKILHQQWNRLFPARCQTYAN